MIPYICSVPEQIYHEEKGISIESTIGDRAIA
jgi:hypothetical protein